MCSSVHSYCYSFFESTVNDVSRFENFTTNFRNSLANSEKLIVSVIFVGVNYLLTTFFFAGVIDTLLWTQQDPRGVPHLVKTAF